MLQWNRLAAILAVSGALAGCTARPPQATPADGPASAQGAAAFTAYNAKNYAEARRLAEPIADSSAVAAYTLARMYYDGLGAAQDLTLARQYFERAALHEHAQALGYLGVIYGSGKGVGVDYAKAREYYQRGSDAGDMTARNNLATYWLVGRGGPKDKAKAMELYQQAADGGSLYAMYSLGKIYETSEWITERPTEAVEYYRRAATHGFFAAHAALASLYIRGIGVPQNAVYAVMHLMLATDPARNIRDEDRRLYDYDAVVRRRDILLPALTPEQRSRAQTLSKLWPDVPPPGAEPFELKTAG